MPACQVVVVMVVVLLLLLGCNCCNVSDSCTEWPPCHAYRMSANTAVPTLYLRELDR